MNHPHATAISPAEAHDRRSRNSALLIDVRTPVEFREVHAEGAHNFPLDRLSVDPIREKRGSSEEPVLVLCKGGSRARKACEKLREAGLEEVRVVEGGTDAWVNQNLPVVRGQKAISLERQVRIAAGSLVFLGTVLAATIHPTFLVIPGFVGAGLVFAGITDTCGMGMMLARMPWNRVGNQTAPANGEE